MLTSRSRVSLHRIAKTCSLQKRRLSVKGGLGPGLGPGPVVFGQKRRSGRGGRAEVSWWAGPVWLVLMSLSAVKQEAAAKASEEEENITEEVCGVSKYAANKPIEDRHFVARLDNGGW